MNFPELRILGLQENMLQNADFIKQIKAPKLLFLGLNGNNINNIKFLYKGQQFEQKISHLNLNQNKLFKFPNCKMNFRNIASLNLNKNKLQSIEGILSCNLQNLQVLDLQKNKLTNTKFMNKINTPSLIDIKMAQNQLVQLTGLRQSYLPKLESIIIKRNRISNSILTQVLVSLRLMNNGDNFKILSAWKNQQILERTQNYFSYLRNNFRKLSFLQV